MPQCVVIAGCRCAVRVQLRNDRFVISDHPTRRHHGVFPADIQQKLAVARTEPAQIRRSGIDHMGQPLTGDGGTVGECDIAVEVDLGMVEGSAIGVEHHVGEEMIGQQRIPTAGYRGVAGHPAVPESRRGHGERFEARVDALPGPRVDRTAQNRVQCHDLFGGQAAVGLGGTAQQHTRDRNGTAADR